MSSRVDKSAKSHCQIQGRTQLRPMTRAKFGDVHGPLVIGSFKWIGFLDFRPKLRNDSGDYWTTTRAMTWVALVTGPPLVALTTRHG